MALDSLVKTDINGTITLSDGTGTPVTMALAFDAGDLSVGPIKKILNETVKIERRGNLITATRGKRIYPSGSFTAYVHQFTDATASVLSDFILRTASSTYASNVSTLGTNHPIYTVDIKYDVEGTDFGGSDSTVTFHDCDVTIDSLAEGESTKFSISFEVLGEITGDLAADELS